MRLLRRRRGPSKVLEDWGRRSMERAVADMNDAYPIVEDAIESETRSESLARLMLELPTPTWTFDLPDGLAMVYIEDATGFEWHFAGVMNGHPMYNGGAQLALEHLQATHGPLTGVDWSEPDGNDV